MPHISREEEASQEQKREEEEHQMKFQGSGSYENQSPTITSHSQRDEAPSSSVQDVFKNLKSQTKALEAQENEMQENALSANASSTQNQTS